MATLGEKLKREREARGVSLKEIAAATRIHENYLRALEENDYGALPGAVFITGFLRNYATHLGLDADKIVIEFEAMKIEPPVKPYAIPGDVDEESSISTLWAVGFLLLLLVIYVAYVNWPDSAPIKGKPAAEKIEPIKAKEAILPDADKAAPPVAKPPAAEPPAKEKPAKEEPPPDSGVTKKKPAPAAVVKKNAAAAVTPEKKKKAVPRPAAATVPEKGYKYRLVVTARDKDAWVFVVVDDAIERDLFVRAGQRIIFNGNKSFIFTTGNASQVSLTLNGRPLHFEIPKSNVLRRWDIPLPEAE